MATIISKKRMQEIDEFLDDIDVYLHDVKILIEAITFAKGKNNMDLTDPIIHWSARSFARREVAMIRELLKIK